MADNLRADVRARVEEAKKILQETPRITVAKFQELTKCAERTASKTLKIARAELKENAQKLAVQKGTDACEIQSVQHKQALRVLQRQLARLDALPDILIALRRETFQMDATGQITGIIPQLKTATSHGEVYHTFASTVNEYLETEKRILEQERLITGIAAAERVATAKAGKTELTLELGFTQEELKQVKPVIDLD